MHFDQSNTSVLQEYATVDFTIVVLKIILLSCVHRYYIQNHVQPSLFCENGNFVRVRV